MIAHRDANTEIPRLDDDLTMQLAIDGGPPAVSKTLPNWPPDFPEIRTALDQILDQGSWGQYHAAPLNDLIDCFAEYLGVRYVWPCCSGTISVEIALRGCGVGAGDEVILAGYDFPGNFRAVESVGALAVLVDVQRDGWVTSGPHIESAMTDKTRAVIVSHLHGQLAAVKTIKSQCAARDIFLVEDACQVPGAMVQGTRAGTTGDVGVFSFGGSKLLSSGRGGAVVTDRQEIFQRVKVFVERGNDAFPLSQLQAAVLTPQLHQLDRLNQQRLDCAAYLRRQFASLNNFGVSDDHWTSENQPAFYKFPLWQRTRRDRAAVISALQAEGVPVDEGFRGFFKRSSRRCRQATEMLNCRRAAASTLLLHHPVLLGDADYLNEIVAAFAKVDRWLTEQGDDNDDNDDNNSGGINDPNP